MHKHLEQHDILTSLQHGFQSRRSCETQLLVTLFDLLSLRDTKVQVDVLVLDFSKAFDTVPHDRLLGKLEHYGISGPILNWINVFLKTREQRVQVGGAFSSPTSGDAGVAPGDGTRPPALPPAYKRPAPGCLLTGQTLCGRLSALPGHTMPGRSVCPAKGPDHTQQVGGHLGHEV